MYRPLQLEYLISALVSLIGVAHCVLQPLPDRLHCLAHVTLGGETPKDLETYHVEEFVSVPSRISSISIHNERNNSNHIYYNTLLTDTFATPRQSVVFEPASMSCKSQRIGDWQLAELRRVAIYFYQISDLDDRYVDVPIGPSVLLFAARNSLAQFKFAQRVHSKSLASYLNVYTRELDYSPANSIFRRLHIVIHVSASGQRRDLSIGDSLLGAHLPDARLDIKFIGACQVAGQMRQTRRQNSTGNNQDNDEGGLDEDAFCSSSQLSNKQKLLFKIRYNIVEEHKLNSLVGKSFDEIELNNYEYAREPFVQPVGIGCWDALPPKSLRVTLFGEQIATSSKSFSATFITTKGSSGLSYVAHDGARHLLRLDRLGRKSIYDLTVGKSYHTGEFSSFTELARQMGAPERSRLDKCIVLDMHEKRSAIKQGREVLDQLLALGSGNAHHLGKQIIEHESLEVHEIGVVLADDVPLLLRAKLDRSGGRKLTWFITYYVQAPDILRFIELYEYEPAHRTRKLVDRLQFIDFSWTLDVEPVDDPESQASNSNMRLFEMEACLQSRATEASLELKFVRNSPNETGQIDAKQLVKTLEFNKQQLVGNIERFLANKLQISILNLADVQLTTTNNGELISRNKVVELRSGLSQLIFLGLVYFFSYTSHDYIMHYEGLRHSPEDCILDSIEYPKANWLAHCPKLAACIMLQPDERLNLKADPADEQLSKDDQIDRCRVYMFKYSTMDSTVIGQVGALEQVEINQRALDGQSYEFEVNSYRDDDTQELRWGHLYRARVSVINYKRMDDLGARLGNEIGLMRGLRYTTLDEQPLAHNSNVRIDLQLGTTSSESDQKYLSLCQLSCQLDEFCASFSVCLGRNQKLKQSPLDCVLSTVRLTGQRLSRIVERAGSRGEGEKSQKFQVNINTDYGSQVLVMFKDDSCSLHPRDFITDYKVTRSFGSAHLSQSHEHPTAPGAELRHLPMDHDGLSLDECASLSFERTFGSKFMHETNFTYCPLDSLCVVRSPEGDQNNEHVNEQLAGAQEGICLRYERRATRAFESLRATHMVVIMSSSHNDENHNQPPGANDGGTMQPLDQLVAQGDAPSGAPVSSFWAPNEEDCARRCSQPKRNCLAFDSCRNRGRVLCLLFSIRSPLSKRGAHMPLLASEMEIHQWGEVKLEGSQICDHFHLKPSYLEVRLRNMLVRQHMGKNASIISSDLEELETNIDSSIDAFDRNETRAYDELSNSNSQHELVSSSKNQQWSWIAGLEFALGVLMGALMMSFKQEAGALGAHLASRFNYRSQSADQHRLVLDDHSRDDTGRASGAQSMTVI